MGLLRAVKRPQVVCGESRTQQHVADLASPKRLIEKYGSKRLREALSRLPSTYSDLPITVDFKEAMDIVTKGQSSFEKLPSKLRKRFENDPVKLLEFMHDAKNRDEAISLGLIKEPTVTDEASRKDVKKAPNETANKADKPADK